MSGGTIWVIIIAVVVVAIIAVLLVARSRKRGRATSSNIGLPDLGALSTEGLDKEHSRGDVPPVSASERERSAQSGQNVTE